MTDIQFESCMRKIQNGDKEGLKEIYESYISFIYATIYQVLQSKENAEDITSEFFIKLWTIADKYRFGEKHRAWLATIARNMAIDFIRKHAKEQMVDEIPEKQTDEVSSLEDEVIAEYSMQEVLASLKKNEREVIHLKIAGEFTFQEISKILKLPMGTITWQYQNAIKKLRRFGYAEEL